MAVNDSMKILITGASGMAGSTLAALLGDGAVPMTRSDLDITDEGAVREAVARIRPTVIVNAAAYTDVDRAESEPQRAHAVNVDGPRAVAAAAADHGAFCIHISTDFVFDGTLGRAYREDDEPNPICVYAASKLAGEREVLAYPGTAVVRTAWLYGAGHHTFLSQILDRARSGQTLKVVDDQSGSPTYVRDLAAGIVALAQRPTPGIFHLAGGGAASRYEFAVAIMRAAGLDASDVGRVRTTDLPARPAPRPAYAPLEPAAWTAAGFTPLREWRAALADAIKEF